MSKYNELTLEFSDFLKLEEKIKALPQKAEYEINSYLWNQGGDIFKKQVYQNMPKSNKNKSGYTKGPKIHAKDTESLDKVTFNLGIKVQTHLKPKSKDFGYLIFPDEGRGKHQRRAQEFFGRALESKEKQIANGIEEHLNKKIEEELQ